jgi:hypothetical protein
MSYLSQKFITNFLDVVHILKVVSHIVVISNYNGDKKIFNSILQEKNRKNIIDIFKKQENDNFFSFLSDFAEKIEDFAKPDGPKYSEIIFDYYLNFMPYITSLLFPLYALIAVIY